MAEVAKKTIILFPTVEFFFSMNEFRRTRLGKLAEDEPNVLEGLPFVTSDGGKGALCSHINQHMVKKPVGTREIAFLAVWASTL